MRSRVMSHGDCNTAGTIMEAILDIFKYIVYKCLVININNIIIHSRTYEEHVRNLKKVLQGLEEQKFYLNENKCQFFTRKLEILVHIVTSDWLQVDPKKRKTILEFPTSTHKKDVHRFLGVANYLQRFLPGLASDASILWELQRECIKCIWTDTHRHAFKRLKELVKSLQILRPWNKESKELKYLICDTSNVGLALWIGQGTLDTIRPACFHSRRSSLAQLRSPTFQKELWAIIDSQHCFEAQLRGYQFVILTDHKPLLTFMQQTLGSQMLGDSKTFLWLLTAPLNILQEKTTISQKLYPEYIHTQTYPPPRTTLFLTALTLQLSNLHKKSLATTSSFQITLLHLLLLQTTHITTCHPAEPLLRESGILVYNS